jgi:heat shock protein HtpX
MWEAIASNQRRSVWLISLMGLLLVLLGAVIGLVIGSLVLDVGRTSGARGAPSLIGELVGSQSGVYFGIAAAVLVWLILWAMAGLAGDGILLRNARAHEIQKEDAPQLWNVVEEMTIASGLGRMPRVFVIDEPSLNAFAVGCRSEQAAVAVTSGLLKRLSRDELQGVIAHEIGHIRNLDTRFMTLASVMLGAIVLISYTFRRAMYYGGRRRSSSRGGGQIQLILLLVVLVLAVLAPLMAQLLYFACSRRREFLADASSARFTRYPEGLASALEKISGQAGSAEPVSRVIAPLCIVNPLQERSAFSLFSTHPKTEDRIRILRSMAGAGFAAYEVAYQQVHGASKRCIGPATLESDESVAIRQPTPEPKTTAQAAARAQQVGELLDRVINFVVIPCPCGVRLKVPPAFKRRSVTCPRCGRQHAVPRAEAGEPAAETVQGQPLRYRRKGSGWESFQCACGHVLQLSPKFSAPQVECGKCGRRVEVVPVPEG